VKYYTNKARQAGMTLIELTVVLLVLVGLAGLLIPYVSGFVAKTHDSTGSSNIAALNNAVIRFTVENYDKYPNKLDSLIDDNNAVFKKMMPEMMGDKYLTEHQLTDAQATSLSNVGISTLMVMNSATSDATFANTMDSTATVGLNTYVAKIDSSVINEASLSERMGKPIDMVYNEYFIFGMGDDSTIAGNTLNDVPVHFAKSANMGADNAYNHFVTVFEVPKEAYCYSGNTTAPTNQSVTGAPAGIQSTELAAAALTTAIDAANTNAVSATTEAACDTAGNVTIVGTATYDNTAGGGTSTDTQGESATIAGIKWITASANAKYLGAAMAMGQGNFEGIGGAISGYYENTAN